MNKLSLHPGADDKRGKVNPTSCELHSREHLELVSQSNRNKGSAACGRNAGAVVTTTIELLLVVVPQRANCSTFHRPTDDRLMSQDKGGGTEILRAPYRLFPVSHRAALN